MFGKMESFQVLPELKLSKIFLKHCRFTDGNNIICFTRLKNALWCTCFWYSNNSIIGGVFEVFTLTPQRLDVCLAAPSQHSSLIKDYFRAKAAFKGLMRLAVPGLSSRLGKALLIFIFHRWVMEGNLYAQSLVRPQPVLMYKKIQFNPCPRSTITPWYMIWG